jgi:hypothetical protein
MSLLWWKITLNTIIVFKYAHVKHFLQAHDSEWEEIAEKVRNQHFFLKLISTFVVSLIKKTLFGKEELTLSSVRGRRISHYFEICENLCLSSYNFQVKKLGKKDTMPRGKDESKDFEQ